MPKSKEVSETLRGTITRRPDVLGAGFLFPFFTPAAA